MAQIKINTDAVAAAVNVVSQGTADMQTRTAGLIQTLEDANNDTNGKWPLLVTLQARLQDEAKNVTSIIEAQEKIKHALNKYTDMASDAASDDVFRM